MNRMIIYYVLIFSLFIVDACDNKKHSRVALPVTNHIDTVSRLQKTDSFLQAETEAMYHNFESADLQTADSCPVKIVSSIVSTDSAGLPLVNIVVTNISHKTLAAFDIGMYVYNNRGQPADNTALTSNFTASIAKGLIGYNHTQTFILSLADYREAATVKPFIRSIYFADGGRWDYTNYLQANGTGLR